MLDIKFIRENREALKKAAENKGIDLNLDRLLEIDKKRIKLVQDIEELNSLKNDLNELMKETKNEAERKEIIEKGKEIKKKLTAAESRYKEIKKEFDELMAKVPVIPSSDTPVGKSDADNQEILRWGKIPDFSAKGESVSGRDFVAKNHIELGKELDILDLEKGAKVGGYRGYYVKNEGVFLIMGLMMYALSKMVEKGYQPMLPPTLVKSFALFGTGYFKGLEYNGETDEIYQVATSDKEANGTISREKKFLAGTAEPSLLAYYADETLKEEDLPIRHCGFSQCYRSEIGSYGKDTKGLYRVHEFMKVEQIVICKADVAESDNLQQEMVAISREMHEELGLPYRLVQICTGDMSPGKYKAFDIETWMPGLDRWGETGSASNFLDWQARRLNIKYIGKEGNKKYVYLLNNTSLPSVRPFIAILENFQQRDGSVVVPEVLRKYMPAGLDIIKKK